MCESYRVRRNALALKYDIQPYQSNSLPRSIFNVDLFGHCDKSCEYLTPSILINTVERVNIRRQLKLYIESFMLKL